MLCHAYDTHIFKTKTLSLISNLQQAECILMANTALPYSYLVITSDAFHYLDHAHVLH